MKFITEFLKDYEKRCLDGQLTHDEIEDDGVTESDITTLRLPHVPATDVYVLATSLSLSPTDTESRVVHTLNLKSVNEFSYDPGENYTINTHMYVKVDKSKPAGVLVSGRNCDTGEYFTLFTA